MVGQHEKRAEIRVLDVRRYIVDNPCQRLNAHDSSLEIRFGFRLAEITER